MDRILRLSQFWNWLPAFRVIAETENIHLAAKRTRIAPSALSRKLKLLEHAIGTPLFDRVGRGIQLNTRGRELLGFVRDAMRLVDDGFVVATSTRHVGVVRISCPSESVLGFLIRSFKMLGAGHPGLIPHVDRNPEREINLSLLDGRSDVAFVERAYPHGHLRTEHVSYMRYGIYRARSHPLQRVRSPELDRVLRLPFVAPPSGEDGTADHWPAELRRNIALVVPSIHAAIEACATTRLLAVLPDAVVAAHHGLVRIGLDVIPRVQIFAVRRPPLGAQPGSIDLVVDALRAAFMRRRRTR